MTKGCKKQVHDLQNESETFSDLSLEQLLYAGIAGVDYEEVRMVLESTNWLEWCPGCGQTEVVERKKIGK